MEGTMAEYEDAPKKYMGLLVQIHGMTEPVVPKGSEMTSQGPIEVNGKIGRAVDWLEETGKYLIQTFDAQLLDIAEDNLKEYEKAPIEEGGFDTCWPYYQDALFDFCGEVNNHVIQKGFCVIQMSKGDESREEALAKAKRKDFVVPKAEFLNDYLGRKGKGKVSYIEPTELITDEDVETMPMPKSELEQYDMDLTTLFAVMGPMTWDSMGFQSMGRTEAQCWLPFASNREESALTPEPLNDDDIEEENLVEKHINFLRRRKLGMLYMVDNEGGSITLHPRSDLKMETVKIPIEKGRLLVFRCDQMSYTFAPAGPHFTMQSWILDAPPKITLGDIVANGDKQAEVFGVTRGPPIPKGERAHIMAGCCLTGGGCWSLEDASCMYLSGTDAHVYVPNTRFDTDLYFTKQGDTDLIPFANSYHHHGGLCYDLEVMSFDNKFFGYSDEEASTMMPAHTKTLEVGYETLFRAGFTKKSLNGKPIMFYLGDCGCEWWSYMLPRQMQGEHLKPEMRHVDWEANRTLAISGQRLSYNLGIRGPTWVCDTACSSGLTAFCTAMYSMKRPTQRGTEAPSMNPQVCGALAGGVNMIVDAGVYIGGSGQHMLSLKGRCFTFDTSGDGYARGEGCSMAYTTISNNEKDHELQEACAIGNKVNQDGRSASMTAPNGPSQQMCIKASLREAGVGPADITASECHGTGTSLGDPIEVGSLRGVQETDERDGPMLCTSSKSNIGHLEANAGTTGLFKCLLMSKYGSGLPNCHMRSLNPHLDISGWPTYMINECCDYAAQTGMVGVSSFGVSGTNSHAEVWAMCKYGPNEAGRKKLEHDKINMVTLTCPVTLGPIDYLTGEPARADGRKYKADVLREELASYDVSSHAYKGDYRYRREALEDYDGELINPPNTKLMIRGSWSGFSFEEMTETEDGYYSTYVILGDTRYETFDFNIGGNADFFFYPAANKANQKIWVEGPDHEAFGRRWIIDGRDAEVPAGTVYQIKFWWGQYRRRVEWEEVAPSNASLATKFAHRYQILGSFNSWRKDELRKDPDEEGIWQYDIKIGVTGQEEFRLCRDHDDQQAIYPAKAKCTNTSVPARGPDDMGDGKGWLLTGAVGEKVKVRLEVDNGRVIVAIKYKSAEHVWESIEGWDRHEYFLVFEGGSCTKMVMDPEVPGVFRGRGTIGNRFNEKYRGICEFFSIIVDEDPKYALYPQVGCAQPGECIVWGPDKGCEGRPFMVKSWQAGSGFEVVLNLLAEDKRQIVTWTWDTPPQYNFGALMDA